MKRKKERPMTFYRFFFTIRTKRLAGYTVLALISIFFLFAFELQAKDIAFVWNASPDSVSGYKLYYKMGEEPSPPYDGMGISQGDSPILVGDVTSFTVTDLADDQTYQFSLTAYNEYGESGYSAVVTISPETPNSKSVNFVWNPNSDPVTGYKLYYKTGENPEDPFNGTGLAEGDSPIVLENVTSFTINGLNTSAIYQFTLTAYNANGESGFSEIVTIGPTPIPIILNIIKR